MAPVLNDDSLLEERVSFLFDIGNRGVRIYLV